MGIIPNSKFGNCSTCGDTNVPCVKVGKNLFCRDKCHRVNKVKQQVTKANQRNALRGLVTYQKVEGILDSIQELTIDLDRVVSRMVRLVAMEKDGKVQCFTCSTRRELKNMQCGHFIPRANMNFRFDWVYNLRPQCPNCNVNLRGNLVVFAENLEKERKGIVEWMQQEARQVVSPTRDELKQLLFDYQQRLRMLENKFKQPT